MSWESAEAEPAVASRRREREARPEARSVVIVRQGGGRSAREKRWKRRRMRDFRVLVGSGRRVLPCWLTAWERSSHWRSRDR
jgi:hypothetical protein